MRKKSKGVKLPPCSKTAHLCPRTVGFHDIIKALHVVNMVYHFHDRDRGRPEEQTLPGLQLHRASPPGCVFCLDQRISRH